MNMPAYHSDNTRIQEAVNVLRYKPVKSTTLERLRLCVEAEKLFSTMAQPLQLGNGLHFILDHIQTPVEDHDLIVGRILEEVPDDAGETFFQDTIGRMGPRPPWMLDGGHESFSWEQLVTMGLPGLEQYARKELERRRENGERQEVLDFLEGMVLVYFSLRNYALRYGQAAWEAGLHTAAQCCFAAAERAPRSFREALQLVWLVGLVYCTVCAINPTLTFGRMDEYLLPFYRRDRAAGKLNETEAGDLIEDFYCKNNLVLGRGEHQMSGGTEHDTTWERNLTYDAPQYVMLGGMRKDGAEPANELTRIFIDRIVPRFENPVIVLRYTDDFPPELWSTACTKMCLNASMMVYNDKVIIPAMVRGGIEEQDAVGYEMFGCNWPHVPGKQRSEIRVMNTVGCLLKALDEMGEEAAKQAVTLDEVFNRFISQFRMDFRQVCQEYRSKRSQWPNQRPGRLRVDDCFLTGPLEKAHSWETGSLQYGGIICSLGYIVNVIDSFMVLDQLVFSSGTVSLAELTGALKNDFKGEEPLRMQCRLKVPKFGQDDEAVDAMARRIVHALYDVIDEEAGRGRDDEILILGSLETDTSNIHVGARTGATPDGRHAGDPLSQNASPSWGACTGGLTALLRSVARFPHERTCSGALNVKVNPGLVKGEMNLKLFAQLLRTYFVLGGSQVQLSVTDTEELRRAQAEPEKYRDLMVRITGYSAAFVDMSPKAQGAIIKREEMLG